MRYSELRDRVAIVTGASNGIGRAIGLGLATEGVSVVISDIDGPNAEKLSLEILALGAKSLTIRSDVSRSEDVHRVVQQTLKQFGSLDILVNNAGIGYATGSLDDPTHTLIENLSEEEWDRVLNVNLKSVFLFCKEVAPIMKRGKWGKIVSISSVAGFTGHGITGGSGPAYGVSKAGIINLTKTVARQLGPYNINVNCVAPGSVPETRFKMTEVEIKQEEDQLPLRHLGRATDIAETVVFLCSDSSRWITGQTISINGGALMR